MNERANENNKLNPFNTAFIQAKSKSGITEIELCKKSKISSSHLHYILKGTTQPSIDLAVRLMMCLGVDFPQFFKELCLKEKLLQIKSPKNDNIQIDMLVEHVRRHANFSNENIFGALFKAFRKINAVTQQEVSAFTSYTVRSIQKVEAGTQNPSVMTALAMVCAVAEKSQTDIGVFFNAYQQILQEISKD